MTTITPKKIDGRKRGAKHPNHKNPPPGPIGNKHALGNSGRPSKVDFPAMAKAMDEWSKRDDALHFGEFALEYDEYPQRLYEWRDKCPEFAESFKKAYIRIALRLRKKLHDPLNPYNYGLFMREIGMYDKMLDEFEDQKEEKKISYKHKLEQQSKFNPEDEKRANKILKQISGLQFSARKIDDKSKSKDK